MSSEKQIAANHVNGCKSRSQVSASGEILDRIAEPRFCVSEAKNLGGSRFLSRTLQLRNHPECNLFTDFGRTNPKFPA
jgi:hypothetical protein